ncbi:MAG: histidine kinase dimerization/phosphoacceptor domain -containing protein [Methanobacteriaceae archaeon]|nr:histidine kinase dimerization/phosphoacceptor domain -containing protein [Methanobacteriaceae archaeon]MDP2837631.1 histidine kinase dimerization/phosphoacceptor domain -containing protein [Methanobacteriaceae archaeon]MDP3034589.1 histidine kinase dimerization/phosphoacceptor domain -containing protein [Methanobacteriaceae archaeon]MDP3624387.1 histidine kinase dimerization/phosphoacceptor domain -containing protein [Methanobacteriaceae archaeon]
MKKKILIVEDEALTSMELEANLQIWGYNPLLAPAGQEAIELALEHHPELILMDIVLEGEMDGVKAIEKIKESYDVPVIYLSAYNDEKTQERAKYTLPHSFISKPFDRHELKFAIELALTKSDLEKKLKDSEKRYRLLADNSTDLISIHDNQGLVQYVSPSCEFLLGYKPAEIIGKDCAKVVHPEEQKFVEESFSKLSKTYDSLTIEFRILKKDGTYVWLETTSKKIIDKDSDLIQIIATSRDISLRKNVEEELKESLEEKKMLIREVNHRVKNNLMVISSLLNLQSRYIDNEEAKQILEDSQNRARSMALVHERLYKSSDLKNLNFGEYASSIATDLLRGHQNKNKSIKLELSLEDIPLDVNLSIPLGLILNELVVNALKHAFPEDTIGNVRIKLSENEHQFVVLEVSDNGMGLPESFDISNINSLGFEIVNTLVRQIAGKLTIQSENGTQIKVEFGI